MKEFILLVFITIVGLMVSFSCTEFSCHETGKSMGMQAKWSIFTDCMVKTPKGWVPLKNYREIE